MLLLLLHYRRYYEEAATTAKDDISLTVDSCKYMVVCEKLDFCWEAVFFVIFCVLQS